MRGKASEIPAGRRQTRLHFSAHITAENGFLRRYLIFFGKFDYDAVMDFEFSTAEEPVTAPDIAVRTIYHVIGDPSYDVRTAGNKRKGYIALRTFDGEGTIDMERRPPIGLRSNSLLFFPYEKVSRYRCSGPVWEFWWFHFDTSIQIPGLCALHHVPETGTERALCYEAVDKLSSHDRFSRSGASIILSRLYSIWLGSLLSSGHKEDSAGHRIKPAIDYLSSNYGRTIRISDLSSICNMSIRRFQDLFLDHTGLTPTSYLGRIRLSAVKEYLANTYLTMKEIAERTGFCNEYYLSRCFRRQNGAPPGEFRRGRTWGESIIPNHPATVPRE